MGAPGRWTVEARRLLDHLESTQMDAIGEAAVICADAIAADGLVHLFGSGHSRIPAEEMFPRYGSYPGFHPVAELSMTFHTEIVGSNGQRQAMFIERVEGLAEVILSNYAFGPDDAFIVFSVSGRSAVPVEIAMGARRRGMPVVVVTSLAESEAAGPTHPSGTRLFDHGGLYAGGHRLCRGQGTGGLSQGGGGRASCGGGRFRGQGYAGGCFQHAFLGPHGRRRRGGAASSRQVCGR